MGADVVRAGDGGVDGVVCPWGVDGVDDGLAGVGDVDRGGGFEEVVGSRAAIVCTSPQASEWVWKRGQEGGGPSLMYSIPHSANVAMSSASWPSLPSVPPQHILPEV